MELHCQLLSYFDTKHILDEVKCACKLYLEEITPKQNANFWPLRHVFEIDVMNLLETYPEAGQMLLNEPSSLQNIATDILYACVTSLIRDTDLRIEPTQVMAIIRLKSVSRLLIRPNRRYYAGLISFQGLLLSVSKPMSYVFHTVWSCPEDCDGNETVLQYIPRVPPRCRVCKSLQFENSGLRRCGEQVNISMKLSNDYLVRKFDIVDDLKLRLNVGLTYVLFGVVLKKSMTIWAIEEVHHLAAPITTPIPKGIKKLLTSCSSLPWKFIYCLASSIGMNVCPLNCFMQLKISLLLSLVSVKSNKHCDTSIIHILVAGNDSHYVNDIMWEASKIADRAISFGTSNTDVSNSLIASSGGVCILSLPIHIYHQKQVSLILNAVESGEISINERNVTMKNSVWVHGMDSSKVNLLNIANVFGFVCRGDYGVHDEEIVEFVLQNAVDPTPCSDIKKVCKEISNYLNVIAGFKVVLDGTAEKLLRKYFLVARKENPRVVSVSCVGALLAVSLNSARLCRRTVANIDDVVFAIWLHISGCPEPRFAPKEYLHTPADVKTLHKIILEFKQWLEQFIGKEVTIC